MSEVTVTMPRNLTPEMIRAVRDNPLTRFDDPEQWHARLGWLICAWDVLVEMRLPPIQEQRRELPVVPQPKRIYWPS